METKLLIVESPAKAHTIGKYLGKEFVVMSSVGHIRDLPTGDKALKIEPDGKDKWKFIPSYEVSDAKKKVVSDLKKAVKSASEIYLASDPDREGEAIAWHLHEVLEKSAGGKPFHRVTYNEITRPAVLKAIAEPREIDIPRVDAQQARRIIDRLVGYGVSPLLWKQIQCANNRKLSAGRVQSVALRLLVERQREIDAFTPETFYLMGVEAKKVSGNDSFVAKLSRLNGEKPNIGKRQQADAILADLAGARLEVAELKSTQKMRHALPPFTTSTMQQAASSVLGMSPGKAMKIAQGLYEQGLITYMRTDSVNISEIARAAAKEFVVSNYGSEFYPEKPNFFKSKADAQGAHEAIRPTDVALTPDKSGLDAAALKLYDLVWRRFLASQMSDARTTLRTVVLDAVKPAMSGSYRFTASATDIDFEGFLKVMKLTLKKTAKDGEEDDTSDEVAKLPPLEQGEMLDACRWLSDEKQTKGPAHYSEASLIKALEENGVGRPSTYAQTIETLKDREYAKTEKRKLIPLERGVLVSNWLTGKLDSLFNVGYTAKMEEELDLIEEQGHPMNDILSEFYAKFKAALENCKEPPPDMAKFDCVFELLSHVKTWNEPKKVGRRIYDDKAFVDSVREQAKSGEREMSQRQLTSLVRLVMMYIDQIPDADKRLREAGLIGGPVPRVEKADNDLVTWTFGVMDRIPGMDRNQFLRSLREQFDHGRGLSLKQFVILARCVGDQSKVLPDCDEVRAKLSTFVPRGFESRPADAAVMPEILRLLGMVKKWHAPAKHGRKSFDDKDFVNSIRSQFSQHQSLSPRQFSALKLVAKRYYDQVPELARRAVEFGIETVAGDKPGHANGNGEKSSNE